MEGMGMRRRLSRGDWETKGIVDRFVEGEVS